MAADKRILALGAVATVLVLATGGIWLSQTKDSDPFGQCRKSVVAGGMEAFGAPFTLTNQQSQRVTDKQVFAKPSLVYFGYTFCPDVCPLDVSRNGEARRLLSERGLDVNDVFITIDPNRDTPEALQSFAEVQDPELIALTGSSEEIDAVAKAWRVYYKLNNQDDPEDYLVDHMTNTFLVMPGQGTVEYFGRDVSPEDMATRTACFVNAAK
ncbi:SCO family protein [Paracoccus aminophilus]|uniref:Electron transport protein SCO1/SenC n=1 Tax=Paracoccus aminophilus JCM 7686 TaxID=1367847 RepID=S5XSN8_PARAH|nr:SCO family protein [Paracoccus aminophilus]AGT10459.1 electron transport protein SCO1/SenC [Paracoccus aminophilus JCM 7686]